VLKVENVEVEEDENVETVETRNTRMPEEAAQETAAKARITVGGSTRRTPIAPQN